MTKALTTSALLVAGLIAISPAFAADEHNIVAGMTAAGAPLGLHGVDPVAFLDLGNRIEGRAKHTAVHDGVAYYFSSEESMKTFSANPAKYVPQNGGFCTYGVSVGKKFDGNPRFAAVQGGKLYVFLSEEIFQAFNKDRASAISKAEANWKKIKHTAAADL